MALSIFPIGVLSEHETIKENSFNIEKAPPVKIGERKYRIRLVWRNILGLIFLHSCALYGIYLAVISAKILTIFFAIFLFEITAIGITAGAHRLWAHRSYKAKWPLRLLLMFITTMAFQGHIILWARDHRTHHKYSDTDADPHNANRGFFFCHIGWLCCRKHPDVIEKGKGIDLSDLYADPILRFQKKFYYEVLMPLCCFVIPTAIPVFFWNESYTNAMFIAGFLRHVCMLHNTFLVNSVAHLYGYKPYDKNILPVQNLIIAIMAVGEGWHNYHHTFPWDYKASELRNYSVNFTNAFIDFFAWIGWAYDLKTVSPELIKNRVQRTGDGSHELWGWGDKDITKEIKEATIIS